MATHNFIKDDGVRFQIVPSTRKITVPAAYKTIGTVGEHNAEQLTFQVPVTVDGHEIKNCARRFITWKNVEGTIGHDPLVFLAEDDEWLYFTWTVRDGVTVAKGAVEFSVHFEDYEGEILQYRWSTAPCTDCEILDSVNAALGTYKAIYVADKILVISDYTPSVDGIPALNTEGIIPSGTLKITEAGLHDVGQYALAEVEQVFEEPIITVNRQNGVVTAEANGLQATHQLTGQDVSGVVGAKMVRVTINQVVGGSSAFSYDMYYTTSASVDSGGYIRLTSGTTGGVSMVTVPQGSIITVVPRTKDDHIRVDAGTGTTVLHAYPAGVVQVTGEETASFTVTMT